MSLFNQLENDLVAALRSRDTNKLNTLRLIISEVKYAIIDLKAKGKELTDQDVIGVLIRESKKRKESIEIFEKAGRTDLSDTEKAELAVIESYLPKQISREELEKIVAEVIESTEKREFGTVMKEVMIRVKGQADGKDVAEAVKLLLA
jgi:uncharacterized protein YqeY